MMNKKAYVFLAEGFEEIEAVTPIDVLRRANIETTIVSITKNIFVKGAHGIEIKADGLFEDYNYHDADMLLLPGGLPGADNLNQHNELGALLKEQNSKGKLIAAICAAPYILGELGLLNNHQATCYPGYENQLIGATISNQKVVVSKNIITSKGAGTAMDFSLALVAQLTTSEIAKTHAERMQFN